MLINNIRKSPTCPIRNTIHAPTRGATSAVAWKWKLHIISIHAPTRGATQNQPFIFSILSISIHAPTRGATTRSLCRRDRRSYFNPRSYKRSDAFTSIKYKLIQFISIHAPTRGATCFLCSFAFLL